MKKPCQKTEMKWLMKSTQILKYKNSAHTSTLSLRWRYPSELPYTKEEKPVISIYAPG